jgi:TetR/AcrR family transcriptional repressor of nem operon
MRKSRVETEETRERILSSASKMFLNQGLGAVEMRDIMAAAHLTQGGFYRHFESKEQLIAEANGAAFDRLFSMFERETLGKSPAEAIEKIVSIYLGQSQGKERPYLCPLTMLGPELSHCDRPVRAIAADGYRRLVQLIADRLTNLRKAEAVALASAFVSTMVGAVTLADIAPDQAMARDILRNAQAVITAQLASRSGLSRIKTRVGGRRTHTRS